MTNRDAYSSGSVGVLVMDASLQPVWLNAEAAQILSYPQEPDSSKTSAAWGQKIRSSFGKQPLGSPSLTELTSGRRRYLCRAFLLKVHAKGNGGPSVAVLLERSPHGMSTLSMAYAQYQLTRREQQALELLSVGLDTKEIANSMQISTNTAKVYVRMVMAKMGANSRLEVLAKILSSRLIKPNLALGLDPHREPRKKESSPLG
jgi:DNA-binding CsgD family transcriptional regulator